MTNSPLRPARAATILLAVFASARAAVSAAQTGTNSPGSPSLWPLLFLFLAFCAIAFLLFVLVVLVLLWRAKRMIENAARPDLPKLHADLARWRARHPGLDDEQLARSIVSSKAHRAGLVGFVTGFGGLPLLPIMLPLDLAATVKIQSQMVHLLRLLRAPDGLADQDFLKQAGLWALTSGGQRLASISTTAVRELVLRTATQSLAKLVPFLGGVLGYALSWFSTQAIGRGALARQGRQARAVERSTQAEPARLE